ncbi:zinc transporter ZntB [Parvularcula mediterranea]|nr:zinc transporter ZntB [Parvularcula mediterranea]
MGSVVEAFSVDAEGVASILPDPRNARVPRGGYLWLHLNLDEAEELVTQGLGLSEQVARALLAAETRPRTSFLGKGILINLRGVNLNDGANPEDMLSLRCWLEPGRLITIRKRRSIAVNHLRDAYREGEGHERPAQLLVEIIRKLMDLIDPVVDGLADSLDGLEARALTEGQNDALRDEISSMRHDAAIYLRYLGPMKDAIAKLNGRDHALISQDENDSLQEEADRAERVVEELGITIDRARVIVDQMAAARSEKMNNNMMVLSVVSAIFLPLGFLTGLLGINVGGLPGTENPLAFTYVVAVCTFIGVVAGIFFKARDWF